MKLLGVGGGGGGEGSCRSNIESGLQLVCGRPTLALSSASVPQTLSCLVCVDFRCGALLFMVIPSS